MMLQKKHVALIAIIIVLIFLFSFSYFSKFIFNLPAIGGESTTPNVEETPPSTTATSPLQKTFSFASTSCTVSGNADTIKFKLQGGNFNIGVGEMASYLDDGGTSCPFKDSQGNKINAIRLNANTISDEFSCTTVDHLPSRKISVSSPAGQLDKSVTCS